LSVGALAAVPPSDASLKGVYAFNTHRAETNSWFAQVSCPKYTGGIIAGSETSTPVTDGTIYFDGKGNLTLSALKYGQFDQTLSNETVTWSCDQNGYPYITNYGYAVYDAPVADNGSATYTINSNYTGVVTDSNGNVHVLRIAGTNAKGLATTVFLHGVDTNNRSKEDGVAIKQ